MSIFLEFTANIKTLAASPFMPLVFKGFKILLHKLKKNLMLILSNSIF